MAKAKSTRHAHAPKVRIVEVGGRTLQLRYIDPDSKKEVRISTGTRDRKQAEREHRQTQDTGRNGKHKDAYVAAGRTGNRPQPTYSGKLHERLCQLP